jgi:CheY-like chemotaxis protein
LGELGYSVPATVATGNGAIEAAGRLRPNLVLMDIKLKGEMDGVAAAKVIRDRFDIPVLYVTSQSSDATQTRAAGSRPQGFLVKPFTDRNLSAAIERSLDSHAVQSGRERAPRPAAPSVDDAAEASQTGHS